MVVIADDYLKQKIKSLSEAVIVGHCFNLFKRERPGSRVSATMTTSNDKQCREVVGEKNPELKP